MSFNLFDMGKNLITMNRHMGDLYYDQLSITHYDYNLNPISSEEIPLSQYINRFHSYDTHYYFYKDGKVMGVVGLGEEEDVKKNYLFVYDLEKHKLSYLDLIAANSDDLKFRDDIFCIQMTKTFIILNTKRKLEWCIGISSEINRKKARGFAPQNWSAAFFYETTPEVVSISDRYNAKIFHFVLP